MKVISFILFGSNPVYLEGAKKNVVLAKQFYPDWVCRFYYDNSVPKKTIEELQELGALTVDMTGSDIRCKMLWRYLENDDETVTVWIKRDADSRLGAREKAAVDEWLRSDKKCHIMRGHPLHRAQILGGLFGAKGKIVPSVKELILRGNPEDKYGGDQDFLASAILPAIKRNVLIHDEFCFSGLYCFGTKKFPKQREDLEFVGEIFEKNDQRNPEHRKKDNKFFY